MSGWGREDESSSSISTSSSSHSRRQESAIDVLAVRDRIVDRIMAKKQREESLRAKDTSASRRRSRGPLTELAQSQDDMDLTQVASTSSNGRNLDWTLGSAKQQSRVYSSTPLPARPDPQRESGTSSSFRVPPPRTPAKSKPPRTSVIPEQGSEEEEPPAPPPPAPAAKVAPVEKKPRARPRKASSQKKPAARPKPRSPTPEQESLAFSSSDDEAPAVESRPQSDEEEQAGPSTRQTSRVSVSKSPTKSTADRSRTAPPRSPAKSTEPTPAKPTRPTPSKPAKPTPAKSSRARPSAPTPRPTAGSAQDPGPSTSRADGPSQAGSSRTSSRRKAPPQKSSTAVAATTKLFKEMRRLQNEPGFLIPRLPFMRVVREITSTVSRENANFRFTVDAMEALQTATEYYLTSVFTDAAALANHARRVTVMPKDLDLLRKLRVVDM